MELRLANHSSYPRIGASGEQQRLRRAYGQRERGEVSADAFNQIQDSVVAEVIGEQVDAGCELLTDGQIRWYDPVSHLAGKLARVEINGLLRYFDTNFYFRQPVTKRRSPRSTSKPPSRPSTSWRCWRRKPRATFRKKRASS